MLSLNLIKVLGYNTYLGSQNILRSAYGKVSAEACLRRTSEDQGPPGAFLFPWFRPRQLHTIPADGYLC